MAEKYAEKSKYARLTPAEWEEVKAMWEMGAATIEEIGKRFDKDAAGLHRRLQKEGIKHGCKKHLITDAISKEINDANTRNIKKIIETREDHYQWSVAIAKLTMHQIVNAQKTSAPLATILPALKSLQTASSILANVRNERWSILGLDKGDPESDELPELVVAGMTPEEIEDIKRKQTKLLPDVDDLDLGEDVIEEG